jgi:hypothetical protein
VFPEEEIERPAEQENGDPHAFGLFEHCLSPCLDFIALSQLAGIFTPKTADPISFKDRR